MDTNCMSKGRRADRAAALLAAGAGIAALSAAALAQAPAPPPEPARIVAGGKAGAGQQSSSYSLVVNENGKTVRLEMKDGVVTRAEIDGRVVPDDRIENDGDVVRLKDESGEVVYEHELPGGMSWNGRGFAAFDLDSPAWRSLTRPGAGGQLNWGRGISGLTAPGSTTWSWSSDDDDGLTVSSIAGAEEFKAPPVMMGVQLGRADSTLCGHLGLDREKVTLLAGVYEGLPADAAGLEPYDLIVSINGSDDAGPAAVRKALEGMKAGDTVNLTVIQKGVRKDVTVTLEAYDRKRLNMAKADRIRADDEDDRFMIATAPGAPAAPLPPLPPTIPEEYQKYVREYLEQALKSARAPRAIAISPFRSRAGGGSGMSQEQRRLLEEVERQQERAAAQAEDLARQAEEMARRMRERGGARAPGDGGESMDEMRERMQRMEEMLRKLMDEKPDQPGSQEPKVKESGNRT